MTMTTTKSGGLVANAPGQSGTGEEIKAIEILASCSAEGMRLMAGKKVNIGDGKGKLSVRAAAELINMGKARAASKQGRPEGGKKAAEDAPADDNEETGNPLI